MAKSVTEQLKDEKARNVELNAKIKELSEQVKVLEAKGGEINLEDLQSLAVGVRFDSEEKLYVLDEVAYSANGIASLVSSTPVAPRGQGEKIEFAFMKLQKYVNEAVKNRLFAEEAERRK